MKKHEYHNNGKTITSIGLELFNAFAGSLPEDLYMFPEFILKSGRTPVQLASRYPDLRDHHEIETDYFYLYDIRKEDFLQIQVLPGSEDLSMLADETFIGLSEEDQDVLTKGAKKLAKLAFEGHVEYIPKKRWQYQGETPSNVVKETLRKVLTNIEKREWLEAQASACDCYTAAIMGWMQCYKTVAVPEAPATFRSMLTTIAEIFKDIKIKPTKRPKGQQLRYKKVKARPPVKNSSQPDTSQSHSD
jgi:hypothetical protein